MITDLRLQHFRSYSDESFELSPGVNIIVGPNASGKTNLLEAILVLARGSSYRAKDSELIQFNQPWARIDCHSEQSGQRTVKLTKDPVPTKSYEVDGKSYKRLTTNHSLPVVLFEPNHLQLLSGGTERRRDYLDDLLEQTVANYGTIRRQYKRTLAQRNALLKHPGHISKDQVFAWDLRLSQLAGKIVRARKQLSETINKDVGRLYGQISGSASKLVIEYKSHWPVTSYESKLLNKLEAGFVDDRARGFTTYGPHREDLLVFINDHQSREVASRGETRTALLAMKIMELRILESKRGTRPMLLLDDVFSELDGKRRHALTDHLASYQTFITTTDADTAISHFTNSVNVISTS